jgi:hypothetical protein
VSGHPDLSERSVLDTAFYEWLLSDHPLAVAERRRRREASFARRAAERAHVREIAGRSPSASLSQSMEQLADGQAQRDRWDQAVDEEIAVEIMRSEWEMHMRVSGDDPEYRYPERYVGPRAADYPPPTPSPV